MNDERGSLYAVERKTGIIKERFLINAQTHSSPVISGPDIYFGSYNGHVYALNKQAMLNPFRPNTYIKIPSTNDLGTIKPNETITPDFYVYNCGEAPDSLSITSSNNKISLGHFEKILNPEDSVKMEFTIDASLFTNKSVIFYLYITSNKSLLTSRISLKYTFKIEQGTTVVSESEVDGTLSLGQNYPNPFSSLTFIPVTLAESGYVVLTLLDESGKVVEILHDGSLSAGNYTFEYNASDLAPGNYFCCLKTASKLSR